MPEDMSLARDRIAQVFRYLEALHQHRNPVKRQVDMQKWHMWLRDLPAHSSVTIGSVLDDPNQPAQAAGEDNYVLRVSRPDVTRPATPPQVIAEWVVGVWDDPFREVEVLPRRNERGPEGETITVSFEARPERVAALETWKAERATWAEAERPARLAMKSFEELYALHGEIEREGEKVELVLGDGILNWRLPSGGLFHPILLQRVELRFDPSVPEFLVVETDHGPELYSSLFQTIDGIDGGALATWQDEARGGNLHPLGGNDVSGFFRRVVASLSPRGSFREEMIGRAEEIDPVISRSPVLFLRERALGFPAAFAAILADLETQNSLPASLVSVVGIETQQTQEADAPFDAITGEPEDVLLSKAANREQIRIAERLNRHASVLVQGPPGTGKSHTIANLIGHLLAQGKSVLVTSHTTKALKVLREHVVPELRPLCVSVLDSDTESRHQLLSAATAIIDRLSSSDHEQLVAEANEAANERGVAFETVSRLRREMRDARTDEYRPVVYAGEQILPSEAAKLDLADREVHSWVPGEIATGSPLPLLANELSDLYATNSKVTLEDEEELSRPLPPLTSLPSASEFEGFVRQHHSFLKAEGETGSAFWTTEPSVEGAEVLIDLAERIVAGVASLGDNVGWQVTIVAAGQRGPEAVGPWTNFVEIIRSVSRIASAAEEDFYQYGPELPEGALEDQAAVVREILAHLEQGKSVGSLAGLIHPSWKKFIRGARTSGRPPRTAKHFGALLQQIELRGRRKELGDRWERQLESLGVVPFETLGAKPELGAVQFADQIERLLSWTRATWAPLEQELADTSLNWPAVMQSAPPNTDPNGDLLRLRDVALGILQVTIRARVARIWRLRSQAVLSGWLEYLHPSQPWGTAPVTIHLREAIATLDIELYRTAFNRLAELAEKRSSAELRLQLLGRLSAAAPGWASAIKHREGVHGAPSPPDHCEKAWRWRQIHDELVRRGTISLSSLQVKLDDAAEILRQSTTKVIDRFAWAAQLRRTSLSTQQALMGWVDIIRRIGAGTGRRVPQLRAAARKNMIESRQAVPVWIMPLSRAAENFVPSAGLFDVVIIDEASQSDVMGLLAFYLGKNVVVVGDHEQVSPSAVGQNLDIISTLIATHLRGIPNSVLYDGRTSVYDLARHSFLGTICLLEHFRCVPEIIEFSNSLSYNGRIQPLRESSGVPLKPHVIAYCVDHAHSANKINELEAYAVASLMIAAMEQTEYADSTMGVISLVGEEQALFIERLLREKVEPLEYDRRRIVCGNAAQFQGDERSVMFLSVVDAPQDGPLRMRRRDEFKQRFNVAASRARDQMWVVHSLDPATDLQPGDLRRELIEFALDPLARVNARAAATRRAESEFERRVIERLMAANYRVTPQVSVGYYRIDMVVEGSGQRLAVECDGERFHPQEKIGEDMARQAVLERLGWRFIRIRGSLFFRDPDAAMEPVFKLLQKIGLEPEGAHRQPSENEPAGQELKVRVITRAQEIRDQWTSQVEGALAGPIIPTDH